MVGHQEVQRLRQLAAHLQGKRIVHVNSTKTGGGVAEILQWMIPLMQELGLQASWEVIKAPPDFYRVTKAFHNGIQGRPVSLKRSDFDLHLDVNRENADRLKTLQAKLTKAIKDENYEQAAQLRDEIKQLAGRSTPKNLTR